METLVGILQIRKSLFKSLLWDPKLLRGKVRIQTPAVRLPNQKHRADNQEAVLLASRLPFYR